MQTQVSKKNDPITIGFGGKNLYIGLDVHKLSWHVTIYSQEMSLKTFTQPPNPKALYNFLSVNYPGANYHSAYEAGFCGYSHHRELNKLGIHNIVVNAADVPKSNKDSHQKTDKSDSRLIGEALRGNLLRGIYIFDPNSEEFRGMFRSRLALAKDIRRTKVRIKSFLLYRNIHIPSKYAKNPRVLAYIKWLKEIEFKDTKAKIQLEQLVERLLFLKEQRRKLEQHLKDNARVIDRELFNLLQTVPGVGPITAIGLMAEIGNIERFKNIKHFASYVGLIPRIKQSGENEQIGGITYRHNYYLRPLLVEGAWQAVRADPAMLKYYQDNCLKGNAKKAIIKVARKLLSKIMFVMRNRTKYERGIV